MDEAQDGVNRLLTWARANNSEDQRVQTSARTLEPGVTQGTSRVPFPVVPRDGYLEQVRGAAIAKRVAEAPRTIVNLEDLRGIQNTINAERLEQHLGNPDLIRAGQKALHTGMPIDLPVVVKKGGVLYIHDGHHRLTAAKLRGATRARVRLVDLDQANDDQ